MKHCLALSLVFLFCTYLNAQQTQVPDNLFPVRSAGYSQGFTQILAGQQLDYPPILQKGKRALFLSAGGKPIAFETAPVPAGTEDQVTFIWESSFQKNSTTQPAAFVLFINSQRYFTFSCPQNGQDKNWMLKNGSAEFSFIASGRTDEKGTVFGYNFLSVPRKTFPTGKVLNISISAESATTADYYTAYQNTVKPTFRPVPLQVLKKINGALKQLLYIEFNHIGPPAQASILLDDKKIQEQQVKLGLNKIFIWVDQVSKNYEISPSLVLDNANKSTWSLPVTLSPVRPFEVYFLPHSHVDIGFTHQQSEVEKLQWRNIEQGIELAKKTANYPEPARYKWNVEVLWAVEGYLQNASPQTRAAFYDAVKKGWIGLDALYGSELTGLQRPEELMQVTSFANKLEREQGIQINSAMITDVPGYAWGIVPALAENEVKYFSIGPNHMPHKPHGGYQVGHTFEAWGDVPFYWEAPSGKNKVLFWMTRHGYSWFHDWLLGKLRNTDGIPILQFLQELENENYPYDLVQIRYTLGDNGGPDTDMPEFVKEWNEEYVYPKFRIATTKEMFEDFEKRYSDKIPTHRGDFTPYWEDGAASSALETALNRNSAEQLVQAQALWAMTGASNFPNKEFDEAWTNIVLFSEHTWGAFSSKSDPDQDFALNQWKVKKGFADNADRQTKVLINKALDALPLPAEEVHAFMVFNTTSWPRSELVKIPASWNAAGFTVYNDKGKALPTQVLSTGELAFYARNIAPFSAMRFNLEPNKGIKVTDFAKAGKYSLSNEVLTVTIDSTTGSINSIRHKDLSFNLVDSSDAYDFNEYWYSGVDASSLQKSSQPIIEIKENGPLVASLLISSNAPGARHFTREIQLAVGSNRVDISNFVDKQKVLEDENLRFSFPFNVPDGQMRIDLAWTLMQPEKDQLKGANKNFFCAQHFVDISNAKEGVTWANLDAPLVETGEMHGQNWMSDLTTEPWLKTWKPSNRLFSWVMNNVWFVNYKGYQEGPVTFRYAISPHKAFDSAEAKRFGIGLTQPLILVPVGDAQKSIPSMLSLSGDHSVMITSVKPLREGNGLLIRVFNASEKPAKANLKWGRKEPAALFKSNQKEKELAPAKNALELDHWEIMTLKAKF